MKKNFISESEVKEILSMHKSLKEADEKLELVDVTVDLVKLRKAIAAGCLKSGKILTNANQTKYVYRVITKSGKTVDFTADMNYKFLDGSKTGKINCPDVTQMTPSPSQNGQPMSATVSNSDANTTLTPIEDTKLDANQIKVLEMLSSKYGWFHEPAPTEVEVEDGLFEKLNLVDMTTDLGRKYGKYFEVKFPKGFYIYKKITSKKPDEVKLAAKKEVSTESCKAAIETLFNNMESPGSYELTSEDYKNYQTIAKLCAEPANRDKFLLRFGLKNKVKELQNARII
jgi:hypothetical protein